VKKQLVAIGVAAVLALLGFVALVRYASTADDRAFEGTEMVQVLQATAEVPANTPAGEVSSNVELVKIPKAAAIAGSITSLDDVQGLVTRAVLVPGDQLTTTKFAQAEEVKGDAAVPKGMQELTIQVGGARFVGGAVQAGDRVGVFSSYDARGVTANPINNLLVLKVGAEIAGSEESAGGLVTVAVTTMQAEKLIHTMEFGKIWMTKQNDDTDTDGGKTIDSEDVAP
jgi:pilus assembly protein CpaB